MSDRGTFIHELERRALLYWGQPLEEATAIAESIWADRQLLQEMLITCGQAAAVPEGIWGDLDSLDWAADRVDTAGRCLVTEDYEDPTQADLSALEGLQIELISQAREISRLADNIRSELNALEEGGTPDGST